MQIKGEKEHITKAIHVYYKLWLTQHQSTLNPEEEKRQQLQ